MSLTKLLLASSVALTSFGIGAAQAQYYAPPPPPPGFYHHHHHHWHEGDRFYGDGRPIHHWERYNLPPPPPGHYWVNQDGEFLLVRPDGVIARIFVP